MKALTFEEWKEKAARDRDPLNMFTWARIGTIPEDEAVRIPKVSEWPVWAKGLVSVFTDETEESCEEWPENEGYIGYIPRHVPAWTPKVDENAFALGADGVSVLTGKVYAEEGDDKYLVTMSGVTRRVFRKHLKPFDASKIGKPWEEI